MSVDRAYIFPNILPEERIVFPLIPFFEQILFLRPVEDDLPELDSPLFHTLAEQAEGSTFLEYTCPAPLAGDRAAFLALLRDIASRPEDYSGHLGNLTAGLGRVVPQEEREQSIMDTLLQQTGIQIQVKKQNNTPEPAKGQGKNATSVQLWQARLLLKLGESVDRNQAEIHRNLDRMLRQQDDLLRELRKEEGADLSSADVLGDALGMLPDEELSSAQQRLRLKAWSRLFALSEEQFDRTVFISRSSDALEALLEQYQQDYGKSAQKVLRLSLPAVFSPASSLVSASAASEGQGEVLSQREGFQDAVAPILKTIRGMLSETLGEVTGVARAADAADTSMSLFSQQEDEDAWNELLERHYPAAEYGRAFLTLYLFPEISPQRLFLRTFARQDEPPAYAAVRSTKRGTLLGILT
ncbi:MAG: hypothetical protein Q3M24_15710 [Candidatus Electrothrix aestuarii]|uniref:Uncharacterized protein n=1 Tax=Candidatus Electrothrix aestuarii TaxID=3062594 RepID=A0AAU8LR42_9BACT|nr:hypothetical protein [Candidatus Electrothrix aestuarii]